MNFIRYTTILKISWLLCFGLSGIYAKNLEQAPGSISTSELSEWTVLVYVQARNNLSSFSGRNFNDMASVGSTKNLNLLVQWYKPEDRGVWRYKIEKNQLALDVHLPAPTDGNSAQDLVDAMQWAAKKYPAKRYCLILWNHGVGILDPAWGSSAIQINKKYLTNNPKIQIPGVTVASNDGDNNFSDEQIFDLASGLDNSLDSSMILMAQNDQHRGILFDEQSKTYMTNQTLSTALHRIKEEVLGGKKIDVVGMDACLMGMIEIAYQMRDYADLMVTSQEVELAYGWNYLGWLQELAAKPLSPVGLAKSIVQSYESMYKNKIPFYTQSAIDLGKIGDLKSFVDMISVDMMTCYAVDGSNFTQIVRRARQTCQQFSSVSYVDLHSFMKELSRELKLSYRVDRGASPELLSLVDRLIASLDSGVKSVEEVVISNVFGKHVLQARGVSIYFPRYMIEPSYEKTSFAREGMWFDLLKQSLAHRSIQSLLSLDGVATLA